LGGGSARRKVTAYTQNKRTQTSTPQVGFEPTFSVFERTKTVHALDRAATVIGTYITSVIKLNRMIWEGPVTQYTRDHKWLQNFDQKTER
jgi:hypothetical protein